MKTYCIPYRGKLYFTRAVSFQKANCNIYYRLKKEDLI